MIQFSKFFFLFLFFINFPAFSTTIQPHNITSRILKQSDQRWFIKEFPRSFMSVYKDKTFVITKDKQPKILDPSTLTDKEQWLLETAQEEFQDYVITPKEGFKGIIILQNKKPVGCLLYRLLEKEKTIYLAQYFILPEAQKKGIGQYVLRILLPQLHPDYKRFEILARHQNDAAFRLYHKLGFSIGDISLVQKYDYDPLRYIGFYKNLF